MAWPVVTVTSGGLPVTDAGALGVPIEEAANKFGTPVTFVASGGLPVTKVGGADITKWMWFTGLLDPAGVVQNIRKFSAWMWAEGILLPGGVVNNARAF